MTKSSDKPIKKVVLAYSGGLDTSIILRWLQETYGCEVVTFTADLGQGEELTPVRAKAESLGVTEIFIEDLREEFVRDYVFPMFRANALYEGQYLLGTSIARPLIAKRQIEIAREVGADAALAGQDSRQAVRAAIARLPERQRLALELCHFQELGNIEAAAIMEVSVDAIESLLGRARRALRDRLMDEAGELIGTLASGRSDMGRGDTP